MTYKKTSQDVFRSSTFQKEEKKKTKCDWKGRHTSPGVDGGSHLRPSGMEQEIWYPVQILNG